jgi:hypothetical protein
MRTPILNLFNEAKWKRASRPYVAEGVSASTPHKDLRAQGWKKTSTTGAGVNVYTHPHHTGHEVHLHPSGHFEHKVNYGPEHKQKGKAAQGMSELAKHLDAHSRTTDYDEHTRAEHRRKQPGGDWT